MTSIYIFRPRLSACEFEMPFRCVVFGCSNTPDPKTGIILHNIPHVIDSRPEAITRDPRIVQSF